MFFFSATKTVDRRDWSYFSLQRRMLKDILFLVLLLKCQLLIPNADLNTDLN